MDSKRRRQLRQKHLEEEERLGKMSRGLSYMDNDDLDEETNDNKKSRFAHRTPKYKARTFKNILREFDDPDFDESQYFGQDYQREEMEEEATDTFIVSPKHDAAITKATKKSDNEQIPNEDENNQDEVEDVNDDADNYLDDYDLDTDLTKTENTESEEDDESENPDLPSDYQPQPIRRKKTLRQLEAEEMRKHDGSSSLRRAKTNSNQYYELPKSKTPAPIRWLAFIAFILLAFLGGYYLCGTLLDLFNIQPSSNIQVEQQVDTMPAQVQNTTEQRRQTDIAAIAPQNGSNVKTYTLFVPKEGSLTQVKIEQKIASSNEQMLKGILNAYLDSTKEAGLLSTNTELVELWIAGDTVYLSMNQNFVSAIKRLNVANATILMRGFLRTMNANMANIKKLKIFVDSQEITDSQPIDLTRDWETM